MGKIIELPENLANKIAAGEVIERPSSVVKELIENSLDADGNRISIELEDSGLKSIRVIDNGEGIMPEEVELALRRHATSKIKQQPDLFRIRTLGFRGEAIPSIASISRFTIVTSTRDGAYGVKLTSLGGNIETKEVVTTPVGTKVLVENLFFNTPARLKYIKSQQSELAHVVDVVNRLGLSHPETSFTLVHDGRKLTHTNGSGDLQQAIARIYGVSSAKKMVSIQASSLDFEISGFVSLPELTRASRNYMNIFINGRYVKNFLFNRAILRGYGRKLMVGRFPLAVIHVQIDPYLVDVNVHPVKQEVRLSKESELMTLLSRAIESSLSESVLIPDAFESFCESRSRKDRKLRDMNLSFDDFEKFKDHRSFSVNTEVVDQPTDSKEVVGNISSNSSADDSRSFVKLADRSSYRGKDLGHLEIDTGKWGKVLNNPDIAEDSNFPDLEYFGQMHGTYLLAQATSGLYILDQHAAQERVKYEYYREKIGEVSSDQQKLLVPYIFEFSVDDILHLRQKMTLLEDIGIHLGEYGINQLILREHPVWLKEGEIEFGIYEICDMLLSTGEVSIKSYRSQLAIRLSCKNSITANQFIDAASARNLILQLSKCNNPYNCPHGRPVLVHFKKSDMEKMFRRTQETHSSLRDLEEY